MNAAWSTVGGLVAVLLWSATVGVSRSLSERLGPLTAAAAVYLVGGALCGVQLGWRRLRGRPCPRPPGRTLWVCGGLFATYTVLLFLAVGGARDRSQVLEVGLLNYLWPALTLWFSLALLGYRARPLLWPGTALALLGVVLVMTSGVELSWDGLAQRLRGSPGPYLLALAAAVTWALYSNLTRRWVQPSSDLAVAWYLPITGVLLGGLRLGVKETTVWGGATVGEALLLGGATALAYTLWDRAMRRGNVLLVVACSYLTPLLSTLVSCVYLGIPPGPRLWTGCLLLTVGSWASWRGVAASDKQAPDARRESAAEA